MLTSHWILLPLLVPLGTGALLLWGHALPLFVQRQLSLVAVVVVLTAGIWAVTQAATGEYLVYALGSWPAPFGILLVLDRLSALMLLLTASLASLCLLYASRGTDRLGANFHALFQFQLLGINGALLTGDLFNLFVFFEVLLIASYALLLHGGGRARSRASLHYVIINLVGSAVFLLALGTLYGALGSLNMADLARRVAQLDPADRGLVQAAAWMLVLVFSIKAAVLPLLFWLPRAYTAASAPVAALFAIMTKIGIYALLRTGWSVFGLGEAPLNLSIWPLLWPLALLTLLLGGLGALGSQSLRSMTAYLVILSVGVLLAGISLATAESLAASLYYLLHSTWMTALFFLLADLIGRQRDQGYDRFYVKAGVRHPAFLGTLFLLASIGLSGLPPLSGFISKIWLWQAALQAGQASLLVPIMIAAGVMVILAFSRAGSAWFWLPEQGQSERPLDQGEVLVVLVLLVVAVWGAWQAEWLADYLRQTAEQLMNAPAYAALLSEAQP